MNMNCIKWLIFMFYSYFYCMRRYIHPIVLIITVKWFCMFVNCKKKHHLFFLPMYSLTFTLKNLMRLFLGTIVWDWISFWFSISIQNLAYYNCNWSHCLHIEVLSNNWHDCSLTWFSLLAMAVCITVSFYFEKEIYFNCLIFFLCIWWRLYARLLVQKTQF